MTYLHNFFIMMQILHHTNFIWVYSGNIFNRLLYSLFHAFLWEGISRLSEQHGWDCPQQQTFRIFSKWAWRVFLSRNAQEHIAVLSQMQFLGLCNDRQAVVGFVLFWWLSVFLQGGVDDTISLTAYIAAALVELHLERNVSDTWTLAGLGNTLHYSFLPWLEASGSTQLELVKDSVIPTLLHNKLNRKIITRWGVLNINGLICSKAEHLLFPAHLKGNNCVWK